VAQRITERHREYNSFYTVDVITSKTGGEAI